MQDKRHPATAGEIVGILGPIDDALMVDILNTGATASEVLEAFTWANAVQCRRH